MRDVEFRTGLSATAHGRSSGQRHPRRRNGRERTQNARAAAEEIRHITQLSAKSLFATPAFSALSHRSRSNAQCAWCCQRAHSSRCSFPIEKPISTTIELFYRYTRVDRDPVVNDTGSEQAHLQQRRRVDAVRIAKSRRRSSECLIRR
jgi:hypothetical protein